MSLSIRENHSGDMISEKTQAFKGSNPSLCAKIISKRQIKIFIVYCDAGKFEKKMF
jgi:hypothetical protein